MNLKNLLPCAVATAMICLPAIAHAEDVTPTGDSSVKQRLDEAGLKYEVDSDGDFKVVFNYSADKRTQLVFVGGSTESVNDFTVREIFAPAGKVGKSVNGKKALELLAESHNNKLGAWEINGDYLMFVIKLPDTANAAQIKAALDIAAETADDMEIELTGKKDEF